MAHSGLLNWANSVRLTMASDPGRHAFKDQVQTLGFLFLDDYLDNILSGARQESVLLLNFHFICINYCIVPLLN